MTTNKPNDMTTDKPNDMTEFSKNRQTPVLAADKDCRLSVPEIIERCKQAMDFRFDAQLAEYLGVSRATLSNWVKRDSLDYALVISKMQAFDLNWLLLGRGEMRRAVTGTRADAAACPGEGEQPGLSADVASARTCTSDVFGEGIVQDIHHPKSIERRTLQSVPLYHIDAAANLRTMLSDEAQYAEGTITVPNAPRCDGAIHVRGNSMTPLIDSGDIIAFRFLASPADAIFGEVYLVSYHKGDEPYLAVKYVERSSRPGYVTLRSENAARHQPADIPLEDIDAMAIVKYTIHLRTIG